MYSVEIQKAAARKTSYNEIEHYNVVAHNWDFEVKNAKEEFNRRFEVEKLTL